MRAAYIVNPVRTTVGMFGRVPALIRRDDLEAHVFRKRRRNPNLWGRRLL